jgi:putative FmdB family regulatory protein
MPTYEYECRSCKARFERSQKMSDEPVRTCPECGGDVERLVGGGIGFIMKGGSPSARFGGSCQFERSGETCCGRDTRCDTPGCDSD